MKTNPKVRPIYADIASRDADAMLLKARLTVEIADLIRRRKLTQTRAAELMGIPQPKLSGILRGRFRGVSEAKLMACLSRLGAKVSVLVRYGEERKTELQAVA